jgi:hypothetical protein
MFEMGSYDPFGHLKHKLWSKERSGVKLPFWLPTTKSRESTKFPRVQVACHILWKTIDKGYNFASDLISIEGLQRKLWAPKIEGVPSLRILGLPLGSHGTKNHLDVAPVERHRVVYYKGEGGGFPQVRAVMSLVSPSCLWFVLEPKVLQLCTNHLVLVLCRHVWVSEACQFYLVPSRSSSSPFYPSKVLQVRERALTPCFFVVLCLGFTFRSLKELGARRPHYFQILETLRFLVQFLVFWELFGMNVMTHPTFEIQTSCWSCFHSSILILIISCALTQVVGFPSWLRHSFVYLLLISF